MSQISDDDPRLVKHGRGFKRLLKAQLEAQIKAKAEAKRVPIPTEKAESGEEHRS